MYRVHANLGFAGYFCEIDLFTWRMFQFDKFTGFAICRLLEI